MAIKSIFPRIARVAVSGELEFGGG